MSLVIGQKTLAQKPPVAASIDWGHPLAQGLSRVWLFNDQTRLRAYDLVRGDIWTHSRNQADVGQCVGPMGTEFQLGASSPQDGFTSSMTNGLGACGVTIALTFRPNGVNGFLEANSRLVTGVNDATHTSPRLYYTATSMRWSACTLGVDVGVDTLATFVSGDYNYSVVASYQRDTAIATYAGTWWVLLNGQFYGPNNQAISTFNGTFSDSVWYGGFDPNASLNSSHMFFEHVYIWNRGLTPTEMRMVDEQPYSFLRQGKGAKNISRSVVTPVGAKIIFRNRLYA